MIIQSIDLENYRQYRNKVSINLDYSKKKNINIILGVNGSGKTNLLNAICWCLYDVEENIEKYSGKKQPIVNDAELKELPNGQSIRTSVKIGMKINDRYVVIERELYHKKGKDGTKYFPTSSEFHVYMQVNTNMVEIAEHQTFINRVLPYGIRNFFIFDGERLDEFFTQENSGKVRDAIFDVSQLTLLEKAIEHLEKTNSEIRKELKGTDPQIDKINEEITAYVGGKEYSKSEKKKSEEQLAQVRTDLSKINDKLKNSNELLVKDLNKRLEDTRRNKGTVVKRVYGNKEKAIYNIIKYGPYIYAYEAMDNSYNLLNQKIKKGEIPPKIKDTFIKELLERGYCICKTPFKHNSDARSNVEQLLNEIIITEISEEATDLKYDTSNLLRYPKEFETEQNKVRYSIREDEEEIIRLDRSYVEDSAQLANFKDIDVGNLEITRNALLKTESGLIGDVRIWEEKMKNADLLIDQSKRKLTHELEKSKKHKEITERLKLAEDTLKLFTNIQSKMITNIQNTVETKTEDYFLKLIWKKDTFKDIKIDKDYNISVINKLGSECLGSLSAGERQVLALSFLAALREVSGFEAPVIIDTPLGRISGEPKENIAQLLPDFLGETQSTLFVTDEEYTNKVRNKMKERVIKEYQLVYDEQSSQTRVVEYGR